MIIGGGMAFTFIKAMVMAWNNHEQPIFGPTFNGHVMVIFYGDV